jgi:hypothetical protein
MNFEALKQAALKFLEYDRQWLSPWPTHEMLNSTYSQPLFPELILWSDDAMVTNLSCHQSKTWIQTQYHRLLLKKPYRNLTLLLQGFIRRQKQATSLGKNVVLECSSHPEPIYWTSWSWQWLINIVVPHGTNTLQGMIPRRSEMVNSP